MIKSLAIILLTISLISACSESDTSSGGADDAATSNKDVSSEDASNNTDASSDKDNSAEEECAVGKYEFRTDSDNKKHFDAQFVSGGVINYNLTDGPRGTWELSGSTMNITGPFGSGRSDADLTFNVTQTASDCSVLQFRGQSLGGAALTVSRI